MTSVVLIATAVAVGILAVLAIRRRTLGRVDDRGDWEKAIVAWRNLRDEGVLSEEEFRNIRRLAEPRTRPGAHADPRRQRPDGHAAGAANERE